MFLEAQLSDELIKTVVDKGLLAIVIALIGFWLNKRLEAFKASNTKLSDEYKAELTKKLEEQKSTQSIELEKLKNEQLRQLAVYKSENDKQLETFRNEQARLNKLAEQTQALKNELQKQRDTRAFDKQLDWYERMIRALHSMAQKIEIAATFEEEGDDKENRARCWRAVQGSHLDLESLSAEANLYGSDEAAKKTARILASVQGVADETEAFDAEDAGENLELINRLPQKLRKAAEPLAVEARKHLGLD
jgi:hypothetical protein